MLVIFLCSPKIYFGPMQDGGQALSGAQAGGQNRAAWWPGSYIRPCPSLGDTSLWPIQQAGARERRFVSIRIALKPLVEDVFIKSPRHRPANRLIAH